MDGGTALVKHRLEIGKAAHPVAVSSMTVGLIDGF